MKCDNLLSVFSTLFFLATFSTAWPWADLLGNAGKIEGVLLPRQNSGGSSSAVSATASNSNSNSNSASATITSSASASGLQSSNGSSSSVSGSNTVSGSSSGTITGSTSRTGTVSGSSTRKSNSTAIDPRLPPGGVSMMIPAATAAMTFLKVGDQITFAWNYTSLSVAPSYIDVVATNTVNSQTYTIAANQTFASTQTVTWDTGDYTASNTLPFVVATYTLMIYDAASEPTAVASAGHLGAFSNLRFGVYTPQPYTPLSDFRCATCSSGAISLHEKQALGVLLGTCIVTIFSFTWFASGFGIL